ncbi:MAG: hypothetical protein JO110_21105 [Acetobacteraceae bacterium]|nr:hypothetical protein [Acetobacteraceae bacterium]
MRGRTEKAGRGAAGGAAEGAANRHAVPYWFLRALPSALGMHRFVRHDGPVSVARGWTREELSQLAKEAGVTARLRWHVPFQWTLEGTSV